MATIQERIKELRTEKGYTQEELAKLLGLNSKSNIANYENGANSPSDKVKMKMCEIFNCSMDYLMGKSNFKTQEEFSHYEKTLFNSAVLDFAPELLNMGLNKDEVLKISDVLSSETKENILSYLLQLQKKISDKKRYQMLINLILEHAKNKLDYDTLKAFKEKNFNLINVPVLGKIAAGKPILADEYIEGYLPVDPNIYGLTTSDELFYLKVSGQSMNLKVKNGDYALIHKQDYAEDGDIIAAIVNGDNEATLKRYKKLTDRFVLLEPMSTDPSIEAITVDLKNTDFKIIGKAIGQFGKF